MKTSVISVHDMLSVLSVVGVEKRIGEVPGVESVTVNFAAGNATVRYDETRIDVADIKSGVRQRSHESDAPETTASNESDESQPTPDAPPPTPAPVPTPAASKPVAVEPAGSTAPTPTASGPVAPGPAVPTPTPTAIPTSPDPAADKDKADDEPGVIEKAAAWVKDTLAGEDKPPAPAGSSPAATEHEGHEGHQAQKAPGAASAMSSDMAHEMGHSGEDMGAMVRDMRNRFWICLIFTVPIFVYAPMGGMWEAPAPPFGLDLSLWLFFFASAAILYPSWPFFVSAWRALRKGVLGMAALIVLSVGTGYIFRPAGKIRAKSATEINSYSGRVVKVGIDSGCKSVG